MIGSCLSRPGRALNTEASRADGRATDAEGGVHLRVARSALARGWHADIGLPTVARARGSRAIEVWTSRRTSAIANVPPVVLRPRIAGRNHARRHTSIRLIVVSVTVVLPTAISPIAPAASRGSRVFAPSALAQGENEHASSFSESALRSCENRLTGGSIRGSWRTRAERCRICVRHPVLASRRNRQGLRRM
jgi:hypothetical protein